MGSNTKFLPHLLHALKQYDWHINKNWHSGSTKIQVGRALYKYLILLQTNKHACTYTYI